MTRELTFIFLLNSFHLLPSGLINPECENLIGSGVVVNVEAFFKEAARQMGVEDYRVLVAESHRRFHPDRWCSRGVFRTCDKELARTLERACTIVSQALTPIWEASRTG